MKHDHGRRKITKKKIWNEGIVYVEEQYPNILFAKDGEIYNFNGKKVMPIGGAYSIDKYYRIRMVCHGLRRNSQMK